LSHLIISPVLIALFAGIVLLMVQNQHIYAKRAISVLSLLAQLASALLLFKAVNTGDILTYALGNWAAPYGIILVADRLAAWMLLITALLAIFAFIYATLNTDRAGRHFHVLFQLQLFGLNGAFLTGDLFNLFVFFEILLLASYGLMLHGGGRLRTKASLHFVVINLAGSTVFLFAVGALYGIVGTLNMADLAQKIPAVSAEHVVIVEAAGLLLFSVFALKAALLPLYLWLPAGYANTSAPVAALFTIMTKVGAYSILRVYSLIFSSSAGASANLIEGWLLPLALASLAIGVIGVVGSQHLRAQVAYLVIASVGTVLIAFGINTSQSISAGLYYLPHTIFASAALFLLADAIALRRGVVADHLVAGPVVSSPRLLGGIFLVLAMLVAGLPPFPGFLGKVMLLKSAVNHAVMPWIFGVVLVGGLLMMIAMARTGSLLFFKANDAYIEAPSSHTALVAPFATIKARELVAIIGLMGLCLMMTIWAEPLIVFTQATSEQLTQPSHYINAVLGQH
jgi:multicomponent K+:H+ antiporter subunit D